MKTILKEHNYNKNFEQQMHACTLIMLMDSDREWQDIQIKRDCLS